MTARESDSCSSARLRTLRQSLQNRRINRKNQSSNCGMASRATQSVWGATIPPTHQPFGEIGARSRNRRLRGALIQVGFSYAELRRKLLHSSDFHRFWAVHSECSPETAACDSCANVAIIWAELARESQTRTEFVTIEVGAASHAWPQLGATKVTVPLSVPTEEKYLASASVTGTCA